MRILFCNMILAVKVRINLFTRVQKSTKKNFFKEIEADLLKGELRKKREEKRQERLKQLESKHNNKQNLKLGAKKL